MTSAKTGPATTPPPEGFKVYYRLTRHGGGFCPQRNGLTGVLTSAMYIGQDGKEFQMRTSSGGLFAQNRFTDMARIAIPQNMLAFQLGESTQIHTGGYL